MYGIDGKPLIELDGFLNVEPLKDLHYQICAAIPLAKPIFGSYGAAMHDPALAERDLHYLRTVFWPGLPSDHPIRRYAAAPNSPMYMSHYLKLVARGLSLGRCILIRYNPQGDYGVIDNAEKNIWHPEHTTLFAPLVRYIEQLPFKAIGRILIFLSDPYAQALPHRDNGAILPDTIANEFIWIRTTRDKQLYLLDDAGQRHHLQGHTCWFNPKDTHATDPVDFMTFSIKIDGVFTDDFRNLIRGSGS